MKNSVEIWHNPRCSKSRQTLALIEEGGVVPNIVLYQDQPPTQKRLKEVLALLGLAAKDILRKGEAAWKEQGLKIDEISEADLIKLMAKNPILIERPIVIADNLTAGKKTAHAILGRPPENVLELL